MSHGVPLQIIAFVNKEQWHTIAVNFQYFVDHGV